MGRKSNYSIEEKVQAVLDYKNGARSIAQICIDLGMSEANAKSGMAVRKWIAEYDKYGEEAFTNKIRNKQYSKDFKETVIKEYFDGNGSLFELSMKYDIPSRSTLRNWINSYNSHEELKDYNPKGEIYMTKSRKTTFEERIEIVQYCLNHDKEYKLAAKVFDVSYAQVYQWVKKYLELGEVGLTDKRGRRKEESQLTELEKLQRENACLKRQLEDKERENIILKKLKEVERRRYSPKTSKNRNI